MEKFEQLKLDLIVIKPFSIITREDQRMHRDRLCKRVSIKIQGVVVEMDLFILPMFGATIIIGAKWMKSLGPITIDLDKVSMKFNYRNKPVLVGNFLG